jgi:hypothetical protein
MRGILCEDVLLLLLLHPRLVREALLRIVDPILELEVENLLGNPIIEGKQTLANYNADPIAPVGVNITHNELGVTEECEHRGVLVVEFLDQEANLGSHAQSWFGSWAIVSDSDLLVLSQGEGQEVEPSFNRFQGLVVAWLGEIEKLLSVIIGQGVVTHLHEFCLDKQAREILA